MGGGCAYTKVLHSDNSQLGDNAPLVLHVNLVLHHREYLKCPSKTNNIGSHVTKHFFLLKLKFLEEGEQEVLVSLDRLN